MDWTNHVVNERVLICVLNDAILQEQSVFRVHSPLLDLPLAELDVKKGRVHVLAGKPDFDRAADLQLASDRLREDLPDHGDLRSCLLTAGLIGYQNDDEVSKAIERLVELSADWRRHPKRLYVGMDTNMMYLRFPSRRLPRGQAVCHVCSHGVEREIAASVNEKYRSEDIQQLKGALGRQAPVDILRNVPMKRSRQAKAAHVEVRHVRSVLGGLKAECEEVTRDTEQNDTLIVSSYARFARDQNADVALFSADRDFVEKAEAAELACTNVLNPSEVPDRVEGDAVAMMRLVHDLAGTFGVVDLRGTGVRVWGAWAGKTAEQYAGDLLRLDVDAGSRMGEELVTDLGILAGIEDGK